jgi:hypothetical protein
MSAGATACEIKPLTTSSEHFCRNPFCKARIEPLADGWRRTKRLYCSGRCKVDGYALRRARALLNKVGILKFHDLLDQA